MCDFNKVAETFNRMAPEPGRHAHALSDGDGVVLTFRAARCTLHIYQGEVEYWFRHAPFDQISLSFSTFNEALVEGMQSCGVGREEQAEIKRAFGIGE
jgi:hypothetical protein